MLKKCGFFLSTSLVVLLMVALIYQIKNEYYLDILFMTFFWASLAAAWNISGGYAGQFSLGHAAYVGIGAYSTALLYINFHVSPWIGMVVGGLFSALLALFIGVITVKVRGTFYTLITIAVAELLYISAIQLKELTHGSEGVSLPFRPGWVNMTFRERETYVVLALLFVVLIYFITKMMERRRIGYYLIAIRENEDAARALGVPVKEMKLLATVLSAFLTAVGGAIYAMYIMFIEPDSVLSFAFSIQPALMSIIGGLGTSLGPLIGSFVLSPLDMFLRESFSHINGLNLLIYGFLLVLFVLFWPEGLWPNAVRTYRKWRGGGVETKS